MRCRKCRNIENNVMSLCSEKVYEPLHEVRCEKCHNTWLVCVFHKKRFSHRLHYRAKKHLDEVDHSSLLENLSKASSNNSVDPSIVTEDNIHLSASFPDSDDDNDSVNNDEELMAPNIAEVTDNVVSVFESNQTTINLHNYNDATRRYIESESSLVGDGLRRIVACAFQMNFNANYSQLSMKEAKYHLQAASFAYNLSTTQKDHFAHLCNQMASTFFPCTSDGNSNLFTSPPMSARDLDRYYLNISTSISNNIPIPSIEECHDHAYVSIKEAIQHFLCFETRIDGMFMEKVSKNYKNIVSISSPLTSSVISDMIRSTFKSKIDSSSMSPLILYIVVWSDDFEPNNVKQHKKSTWIKTITIAPPIDCQTSPQHTYIIALSSKNTNHEVINHYFNQELNELKSPTYIYCRATNSNIPIVVETLAISADRPERSALNSMLGHNGITSRRWRYSAYINTQKTKSCLRCMLRRVDSLRNDKFTVIKTTQICCCDWDFSNAQMRSVKPPDYPTREHPNSPSPPLGREINENEYLLPLELTYNILIEGAKYSFFNCYHNMWTKTSTVTYLKSLGINEKYAINDIYDTASVCRSIPNFDESSLYNHLTYPVLWTSGSSLEQCIDTPMHQLFQGIVKTIVDETSDWLSRKYRPMYKAFGDKVNNLMIKIHNVGVDWCRMERLMKGRSYTTSGWQAEQYIAFARCMLIIYASIRDIVGDEETGINEHECMIQSLLCLLSRLMNDDNSNEMEHCDYIKCFLSFCDLFENVAYKLDDQNPFWFKKGNFLSLLNLPSQIEKFGSLKYYWEGSRERTIQQIKPYLIKTRLTSSFYKAKLKKMYTSQTFKVMNDLFQDENAYKSSSYERFSSFNVYSFNHELSALINDRDVISVIVLDHNSSKDQFYICQRNQQCDKYSLREVIFFDKEGFNKCGLWYSPIQVASSSFSKKVTKAEINNSIIDYALLIPCISSHEFLNCCYTVISKTWKTRTTASKLSLPMLSFDFLTSTINDHM